MSTAPLPSPDRPDFTQTRELLRFVQEQNTADREAIRNESEANRKLLLDSLKVLSFPVGILLAIAAFLGFRSVSDLKQTIQNEARNETQAEVKRMQDEIRNRLNDQFQTPAIQKMVREAAAESTKTSATPMIKAEVATQVKSRVEAERPSITAAVNQQTQTAVKEMGTKIDVLVKDAVDSKVKAQVESVVEQVNLLKGEADIQLMITRMNADDARAFDSLSALKPDPDSEDWRLINSAIRSVYDTHAGGFYMSRNFNQPITEEQMIAVLRHPDASMRQASLDTLVSKPHPEILPDLVGMITSDPSLNVRCAAYRLFNAYTKQSFKCLDKNGVLQWWEANKKTAVAP